ncbi:MAG: LamG domain-containing protein, partial [Deltaproteobacteria bacterium]|nr:LamG domain-containing protein [Deltaproteobacteria bacterium]
NGRSSNPISLAFSPSIGVWYHWAITRTGTSWRLYRNGQLVDGPNTDDTPIPNIAALLTIGNAERGWHAGLIDDVRIWGEARSQAEIQSSMDRELSGDEPNLLGYWALDSSAQDYTPNGRHGTLVGNPAFVGDTP